MFRLPMQQTLEELIIQTQLVSPPQLAVAQRDAGIRNRGLAQTLIELGFVTDHKFAEWIANAAKLPLVEEISPDVVSDLERYMPRAVAREYDVIPIDAEADEMTVVMVNPLDRDAVSAIADATGMKIHPVVGVYSNLRELVNRFYPEKRLDPSVTIAAPMPDQDPFDIGTDTLLRHSREALFEKEENTFSETRISPRMTPPPEAIPSATPEGHADEMHAESQLDRMERQLGELLRTIEALRRRIDAIDSTLARVVNR
jgi:MshEN domain